jgi:DNA polymerase III epsilon subunit-like protein
MAVTESMFSELEFASFDVETTGLDPARDRVLEVAVVRTRADGTIISEFETLINPLYDFADGGVHGIRAVDVLGAPTFAEASPRLLDALSGAIVVAHNAVFDISFIAAEHARMGIEIRLPYICTKELRALVGLPGSRWLTLEKSAREVGIELVGAHTALADARVTAQLLVTYLQRAQAQGAVTLADLIKQDIGTEQPIFAFSWQHQPLSAPPYFSRLFTKLPRDLA